MNYEQVIIVIIVVIAVIALFIQIYKLMKIVYLILVLELKMRLEAWLTVPNLLKTILPNHLYFILYPMIVYLWDKLEIHERQISIKFDDGTKITLDSADEQSIYEFLQSLTIKVKVDDHEHSKGSG